MMTARTENPDDVIRRFQSRMSQLNDPIVRDVLDPIVIEAQTFSTTYPNGGQTIVGAIESQILRAPSFQKYSMFVLIDAMCRARFSFAFKAQFAQNLEKIFPVSYFYY